MDNKFIYCFDEEVSEKMKKNGYGFMKKTDYNGKSAYLFMNNGSKMSFAEGEIQFSNKLNF